MNSRSTRRSFLAGALSTLALPMLVSALPRRSRAAAERAAAVPGKRLVVFCLPNGLHPGAFPNDGALTGIANGSTNFTLPPVLQPLSPYRSSLLMMNSLSNLAATVGGQGDHARGTAAVLTCTTAVPNATPVANISVDQIVANAVGSSYPLASLQLGTDTSNLSGQCDIGYSCTYTSVLAWKDAQTPLPNLTSAAALFRRMFGSGSGSGSGSPAVLGQRNSILDYATQDLQLLNRGLQAADQQKLDDYLTGLRALEKQINFGSSCSAGGAPVDSPLYANHVQQMMDTLVLGLQCNLTPVVTLMLGNGQGNRVFSFLTRNGQPLSEGHHSLTHDGNSSDVYDQLTLVESWEMQQFAYLLGKLQATPDSSGTLFDNTLLMLTSELGHGEDHDHTNLPVILAGGSNTRSIFTPGRYIQQPSGTPIANLFVSLLNAFTPTTQFRDSSGAMNLL